jgi:AraC-like DNA-binding protein
VDFLSIVQSVQVGIYIAALAICALFTTLIVKSALPYKLYLMVFLVIKALVLCCEWLLIHINNPANFFFLSLIIVLSFATAPVLLRFAQSISSVRDEHVIEKMKSWEWALVLAGITLCAPLLIASQVLFRFEVSPWFGRFIHFTLSACILVFAFQVALYWRKTLSIYRSELQQVMNHSASLQHASLKILKLLLLMVLINWLVSLLRTFNVWFFHSHAEIAVAANLLEYGLMLVVMFFMFHSSLPLHHKQTVSKTNEKRLIIEETNPAPETVKLPKYAKAQLDDVFRSIIIEKLANTQKVTLLARDNAISLSKFANSIGEKSSYVSQVLNQNLQTSFYEYITDFRIRDVIEQLSKPSSDTIYDIAIAAGFNSKSAFNKAFKKRTGLTPSAFRKQKVVDVSVPAA